MCAIFAILLALPIQSSDEDLLNKVNSFRAGVRGLKSTSELAPLLPTQIESSAPINSRTFRFENETVDVDRNSLRVIRYSVIHRPQQALVEWPENALEEAAASKKAISFLQLARPDVAYSVSSTEKVLWQNHGYLFGLWPRQGNIIFDPYRYLAAVQVDAVHGSLVLLRQDELPEPDFYSVPRLSRESARYRALEFAEQLRMAEGTLLSEYIPMQLVHYRAKGERSAGVPTYFATPEQIEKGKENRAVLAYCVGYDDVSSFSEVKGVTRKLVIYIDAVTGVPIELMELRAAGGGTPINTNFWSSFAGQVRLLGRDGKYVPVPSGLVSEVDVPFNDSGAKHVVLRRGTVYVRALYDGKNQLLAIKRGESVIVGKPSASLIAALNKM